MAEQDINKVKEELKIIKTIHLALMSGVFIFMLIVGFVLTDPSSLSMDESDNIFNYIVPGIGILAFFAAKHFNKIPLKNISSKNLLEKLAAFKSSLTIKLSLYQGGGTFAVVATLLTNSYNFLVITMIMLVLMYMARPTKEKMKRELSLTPDEMMLI